jgi:hypothetical protein
MLFNASAQIGSEHLLLLAALVGLDLMGCSSHMPCLMQQSTHQQLFLQHMSHVWQLTCAAHCVCTLDLTDERNICCPPVCLQPVFQLGLPGRNISTVQGGGACQITRGSMEVAGQSARLLPDANGTICWNLDIHSAEAYLVDVHFTKNRPVLPDFELQVGSVTASWRADTSAANSTQNATGIAEVSLSLGPSDIGRTQACFRLLQTGLAGNSSTTDNNTTGVVPPVIDDGTAGNMTGNSTAGNITGNSTAGNMTGNSTAGNMTGNSTAGNMTGGGEDSKPQAGFKIELLALRFIKANATEAGGGATQGGGDRRGSRLAAGSSKPPSSSQTESKASQVPAGMPADLAKFSLAEPAVYLHLQPTPAMQEMERRIRAAEVAAARQHNPASASGGLALASIGSGAGAGTPDQVWTQLQQRYRWADQQGRFESLFRPCKVHSLPQCAEDCDD